MFAASLYRLLSRPTSGGLLLLIGALTSIMMANTSAREIYNAIIHFPQIEKWEPMHLTFQAIVNDGLMTIFFLTVGLEIKYELLEGTLNSREKAMLPAIAALGGVIIPAVIYSVITANIPELRLGWAIPAATDIAFAVGVLSLLGSRVPISLKVFLLALAIIDDLSAIVIIALFYNHALNILFLILSGITVWLMVLMNRTNIECTKFYLIMGFLLWMFILLSGLHATLAGVLVGGSVPLRVPRSSESPSLELKNKLKPWVEYLILPLFAFTNAGISFLDMSSNDLISLLPWGIAIGLVIGKPSGIILFTSIALKLKLAQLPFGLSFRHIIAVAMLCGIGFTMSIFISTLAFAYEHESIIVLAKIGILSGSAISAILGYLFLHWVLPRSS